MPAPAHLFCQVSHHICHGDALQFVFYGVLDALDLIVQGLMDISADHALRMRVLVKMEEAGLVDRVDRFVDVVQS